jgi:N-acetylmuramoyl-L-alanine amidase
MVKYLAGRLRDRGLKSDMATRVGAQQGALTGSIYSHVPVLLVEMCVLTNPHDEALVATDEGQETMARALAQGVMAALAALNKSGQ